MAVEEFQPTKKWFLKLTLQTKWITPSEKALKTVPENGVGSCVHIFRGNLGLWKDVKIEINITDVPLLQHFSITPFFKKQW